MTQDVGHTPDPYEGMTNADWQRREFALVGNIASMKAMLQQALDECAQAKDDRHEALKEIMALDEKLTDLEITLERTRARLQEAEAGGNRTGPLFEACEGRVPIELVLADLRLLGIETNHEMRIEEFSIERQGVWTEPVSFQMTGTFYPHSRLDLTLWGLPVRTHPSLLPNCMMLVHEGVRGGELVTLSHRWDYTEVADHCFKALQRYRGRLGSDPTHWLVPDQAFIDRMRKEGDKQMRPDPSDAEEVAVEGMGVHRKAAWRQVAQRLGLRPVRKP